MTKLHLGCGSKFLDGFIHIDCDYLPHIDYVSNLNDLSMFKDGSVDEIYCCGAIIYYDREEAVELLREWRRVLKEDGILRVSVGDFEKIVQVYYNNEKNLDGRGILGPLFGKWEIRDKNDHKSFIYQKTTYDFNSLKNILQKNGFTDVKRYDWKEFLPKDYDDYSKAYIPHMDENGLLISLNVICKKQND